MPNIQNSLLSAVLHLYIHNKFYRVFFIYDIMVYFQSIRE